MSTPTLNLLCVYFYQKSILKTTTYMMNKKANCIVSSPPRISGGGCGLENRLPGGGGIPNNPGGPFNNFFFLSYMITFKSHPISKKATASQNKTYNWAAVADVVPNIANVDFKLCSAPLIMKTIACVARASVFTVKRENGY